jgi:hypothetical protein
MDPPFPSVVVLVAQSQLTLHSFEVDETTTGCCGSVVGFGLNVEADNTKLRVRMLMIDGFCTEKAIDGITIAVTNKATTNHEE